jgi:uncharacterized protein YceH (UPF0502 family)
MYIHLTPHEARLIGCLIEKQITTPDQYPLSLNALVHACNQKSNRDPVLELDEATVQQSLDELIKKHLASEKGGFGGRVAKYVHRLCNTEFGVLKFSEHELGIICELLLRGPQTPGELRTRTSRLSRFGDVREVERTLAGLMAREDGPFVARLPREPGRREARYAHLFSGPVQADQAPSLAERPESPESPTYHDRLVALEGALDALRAELHSLRVELAQMRLGRAGGDSTDPEPGNLTGG